MEVGQWASVALRIVIMIVSIVFTVAFIGGITWWVIRWRRFTEYQCRIFEFDGLDQLRAKTDGAGVFVDKATKTKLFFLKRGRVGLNPDSIPYVTEGKKKVVYLLKTGQKNYVYLKFKLRKDLLKIKPVGEEDVNWAINDYTKSKKIFQNTLLIQLIPYMAIAFVSIIILVIFIYFFKEFSSLSAMADSLSEAAKAIRDANAGTTVIQ